MPQTGFDAGAVGAIANNPYLNQQIQAAQRPTERALYEQQLPANRAAAARYGQSRSDSEGVASGIMQRGAADRNADISAQMRSAAYAKGLDYNQNQQQFNAKMQAGLQQHAAQQAAAQGQQGLANLGQGYNIEATNLQNRYGIESQYQDEEQRQLNESRAEKEFETYGHLDFINQVVGQPGSGSRRENPRPNKFSQALNSFGQLGRSAQGQEQQRLNYEREMSAKYEDWQPDPNAPKSFVQQVKAVPGQISSFMDRFGNQGN